MLTPSPTVSGCTDKRITSPEQLDQLITVVPPLGWFALATIAALLVTVLVWGIYGRLPVTTVGRGILVHAGGVQAVTAMSPGQVTEVLVRVGDEVHLGQEIARLQSAGSYPTLSVVTVTAPYEGRVVQVLARKGQVLGPSDGVVNLSSPTDRLTGFLYVSASEGKKIRSGMDVHLMPTNVDSQKYGYLMGQVTAVARYASTTQQMNAELGNANLVAALQEGKDLFQSAPLRIDVELETNPATASGYRWSSKKGPSFLLTPDTVCQAEIVTDVEAPLDLVIPYLLKRFGAAPP